MDHIKAAFDAFKRHPLQWFLLGLLFGAMSNLVVGIFLLQLHPDRPRVRAGGADPHRRLVTCSTSITSAMTS